MKQDKRDWTDHRNYDKSGDVHFFDGDDRFCGSRLFGRRFTLKDHEVTCQKCMGNDRLVITEQGKQALRDLGYKV